MIEERDLDAAVAAGIIDAGTRVRLEQFTRDHRRGAAGPDEEQFRLLTGFNDIFVTIAVGLVLFAVSSLGSGIAPVAGPALVAATSWGLAEYFTRQRRMALPSIVLLLAFVGGVFGAILMLGSPAGMGGPGTAPWLIAAAAAAVVAAYAHWRRFMVPITVAAGVAALGILVVSTAGAVLSATIGSQALLPLVFVLGLAAFGLAMMFDSRDRARVTRWTDVAFWLHLLAAPAIIHPVFAMTGLLDRAPAPGAAALVVLVYGVLTIIALAIDRRALLVSALGYVIYAIQALIGSGGAISAGFGVTALIIGLFLVLLSAAWRPVRAAVLARLPATLTSRLPLAAV